MSKEIDQLLDTLTDQALPIPFERLRTLSDLGTAETDQLRQIWDLFSIDKRRSIMQEFGKLADDNIELNFELINKHALTDQDAEVRQTAILNLWESETHSLIPVFVDILINDPSSNVRAAAADALGRFVFISETQDIDPDLKLNLENALINTLQEKQGESVYLACLESLGYSSRSEVPKFIQQAYETGADKQMRSALLAMGRSVNKIWQEQVIKELNNPDPKIRLVAAEAAGELELREGLHDLIELVEDVNKDVRHAAIWSISQVGVDQAGDILTALFDASEDDDETQILQDAIDNFAFTSGSRDFLLLDFDEIEDDLS